MTASVSKNSFKAAGTRVPSSDNTPSANAISVAAGMAQPAMLTGSLRLMAR